MIKSMGLQNVSNERRRNSKNLNNKVIVLREGVWPGFQDEIFKRFKKRANNPNLNNLKQRK